MSDWTLPFRRTGRTSRMLARAIEEAKAGREVYVIAANPRQARHLEAQARAIAGRPVRAGDNLSRLYGIRFLPMQSEQVDVERGRVLGVSEARDAEATVLFDHYALESHYARVLERIHEYDAGGAFERNVWPAVTGGEG